MAAKKTTMGNNVADIFNRYRRKLLAFVRDRVPDDDAEDILQDVFLRLIQTESSDSVMQVSGWLYQTARNRITDYYRKQREEELPPVGSERGDGTFIREVSDVLNDDERSPEKEYLRALVWEELEKALGELPDEQRTVFEQTELCGISFRELSEKSGVSVKTLLSRKHYAVKYLRERLKEIYEAILYDE